ncbi:MAG: sulfatase-like hydrolase/transferase [Chloroflexi bacterium]|nr:sulfatase-like hydrolase/transferase [Chloroflexota bacterium]
MPPRPTNLLFIMSDQHTRHVLGSYGNPAVATPALDALAARGTRFATAYCNFPICVPSRASFATGRYAHTIRSWDNASPYVGTEAPSWGHRLSAQGYRVTTIGKLHYRRVEDPTGFPDQRLPMHVVDGEGDLYSLLREAMPVRPHSRRQVLEARAGDSEYLRYDRAIAQEAARWLQEEGRAQRRPWCLFVSFVTPHFPLIAPPEQFERYAPERLPLPVQWCADSWPHHPVIDHQRRQQALDKPFSEAEVRQALVAYYGLVSFLDEQIGTVLRTLAETGLQEETRVVYTSDHGEMLGEHGLWWKSSLYDGSVGVPLIVAGPDVPVGRVVHTPVTLVDCFPTIVEAVGAELQSEDADLPGRSLWELAQAPEQHRLAFAEYHAIFAPAGSFMLSDGHFKLHYFVRVPPQLFNLDRDPAECHDVAGDPAYAAVCEQLEQMLRDIVDPEAADRQARADQDRKLEAAGGRAQVLAGGVRIPYTPAPSTFRLVQQPAEEHSG